MGGSGQHRRHRHPGLIVLALAALWMQVLIPQGFMVGATAGAPALVICTGHGALQAADHPGKAPKPASDAPCAFAGHGVAAAPPILTPLALAGFQPTALAVQSFVCQSPGRGLAAPPPPSQGPPQLI